MPRSRPLPLLRACTITVSTPTRFGHLKVPSFCLLLPVVQWWTKVNREGKPAAKLDPTTTRRITEALECLINYNEHQMMSLGLSKYSFLIPVVSGLH